MQSTCRAGATAVSTQVDMNEVNTVADEALQPGYYEEVLAKFNKPLPDIKY